jgi:hypothetical protein
VFVDPAISPPEIFYSKTKATKSAIRLPEIIRSGDLGPYGGGRAGLAWWIMATAGVDYCAGVRAFGFKEKAMLAEVGSPALADIVSFDGQSTVTLNVTVWLRILATVRRRLIKTDSVVEFNAEMDRIWFCLLYYMGREPQRQPRGGPLRTRQTWVPIEWGATLTDVLCSDTLGAREDRFISHTDSPEHADGAPRYALSV